MPDDLNDAYAHAAERAGEYFPATVQEPVELDLLPEEWRAVVRFVQRFDAILDRIEPLLPMIESVAKDAGPTVERLLSHPMLSLFGGRKP